MRSYLHFMSVFLGLCSVAESTRATECLCARVCASIGTVEPGLVDPGATLDQDRVRGSSDHFSTWWWWGVRQHQHYVQFREGVTNIHEVSDCEVHLHILNSGWDETETEKS